MTLRRVYKSNSGTDLVILVTKKTANGFNTSWIGIMFALMKHENIAQMFA